MTRRVLESATAEEGGWRRAPSARETERLGAAIAARLRTGDLVCLSGPLGAGKTTLARGLVRAITSPDQEVPSPTFTLVQSYEGFRFPVAHFDLYRLKRPEEALELGFDEALEQGAAVVEWPERLGALLPPDRLEVELRTPVAGPGRLVRLTGRGTWSSRIEALALIGEST